MMAERWRPVVGWEGWYEVSNLGQVRRAVNPIGKGRQTAGRILKLWPGRRGRTGKHGHSWRVYLGKLGQRAKPFSVHHLVAEAFIGPRPAGKQINHKDGDPQNNRAENLEWVTASENLKHAHRTGLKPPPTNTTVLNPHLVREIRKKYTGRNGPALAAEYGLKPQAINRLIRRETWKNVE